MAAPPRPRARSAAYIQRRSPGLSLEEAQFESAIEHRLARLPSLEGLQAAARKRPHIGHVSLEGHHAPIRAALDRRFVLEGPPQDLIRGAGVNPALIHHRRSK